MTGRGRDDVLVRLSGPAATVTAAASSERAAVPGFASPADAARASSRIVAPASGLDEAPPLVPWPTTDPSWSEAVRTFKRHLLEHALAAAGGNRTHAARALGLQRTYLLKLIHDLGAQAPPARHGVRNALNPSTPPAAR